MICSWLLLMASPNTAVHRTVFSYCHNCSIAQGNRTKRSFNIAVFLVFTMLLGISYPSLTPLETFLNTDSSSYAHLFWVFRVPTWKRTSTSCTTFLKPSDTNDKHNHSNDNTVHYIYFCIIYNFYDLIHWKDKPLERWQVFWCLLPGTFFHTMTVL